MVMQAIRRRSQGIVAYILIGLIAVVFALFGLGSITTFLAPVPKVRTVNGDAITEQEMALQVERLRQQVLDQGLTIAEDGLRNIALEGLTRDLLVKQASEKLRLAFADSHLNEIIRATESFQIGGVFDADQYRWVLAQNGFSPATFRENLRTQQINTQLSGSFSQSDFMLPGESRHIFQLFDQTRDLAWLLLPVSQFVDETAITDAEIAGYYAEHPTSFMTDETVTVEYLELSLDDIQASVVLSEEEITAWYEKNQEDYGTPEGRRAAHLLFETGGGTTDEDARSRAEDAWSRLEAGEDFASLAEEVSDDPGSAAGGGDLGFAGPGAYDEAFEEALYRLEPGEITKPVETPFGFHIIKLLEVRAASVPPLDEVREQVRRDAGKYQAEEIFAEKSLKLADIVYESPDLQQAADELQLEVRQAEPFTRSSRSGIAAWPEVTEAAFSAAVLFDGYNSEVLELAAEHQLVLRLVSHQPSVPRDLADVQDDIREQLRTEAAEDLASEAADQALELLKSGSSAAYVADEAGAEWKVAAESVRNNPDIDQSILEEAFRLPSPQEGGKSIGSLVLPGGDAAVIAVTRVQSQLTNFEEYMESGTDETLAGSRGSITYLEYLQHLENDARIR